LRKQIRSVKIVKQRKELKDRKDIRSGTILITITCVESKREVIFISWPV
jgi:hypothetical protein